MGENELRLGLRLVLGLELGLGLFLRLGLCATGGQPNAFGLRSSIYFIFKRATLGLEKLPKKKNVNQNK